MSPALTASQLRRTSFRRALRLAPLALLLGTSAGPVVQAGTIYYDINAPTTGFQGGPGTWDVATTAIWNTSPTGANTSLVQFQTSDDVNFNATNAASTITIQTGGVAPASTSVNSTQTHIFKGGTITSGSVSKSGTGNANFGDSVASLVNGYAESFAFNGGTSVTGGTLTFIVTNNGLSTVNPQIFSFGSANIALGGGTFSFLVNAVTSGANKSFVLTNNFDVTGTGNAITLGRSTATNNNPTGLNISGGINLAAGSLVRINQIAAGTTTGEEQIRGTVTVDGAATIQRASTGQSTNNNLALTGNIVNGATAGVLSLQSSNAAASDLSVLRIAGTGNTYSGGTTIVSGVGTVQVAAASKLGTGNVVVNSATTGALEELSLLGNTNIDSAASLTIVSGAQVKLGFTNSSPGVLDASDMTLSSLTLGSTTYTPGLTDQIFSASNFPTYFTGTGEIVIPVPEPASLGLLSLGIAALLGRPRRKPQA